MVVLIRNTLVGMVIMAYYVLKTPEFAVPISSQSFPHNRRAENDAGWKVAVLSMSEAKG